MVGGWDDVGQVQCFLVGHRVGDLEEVYIGEGAADVLALATGVVTGET